MAIGNLITVEEAASEIGVTVRRVHQFIEKKRLTVEKTVGPVFLLDERKVKEFARRERFPGRPKTDPKK